MKKIVLIWLALSIAFMVLFGTALDTELYITRLNSKLPDWNTLFNDITLTLDNLKSFDWGAVEVSSLDTFFKAFANFFKGVGVFFQFLYQVVLGLPIKLIIFIVKTIVAFVPLGAETTL